MPTLPAIGGSYTHEDLEAMAIAADPPVPEPNPESEPEAEPDDPAAPATDPEEA